MLGSAVRYGLPEWRTVGARGDDAALAACSGPAFNGGLAVIAQWWTTTTDYDLVCPAYNSPVSLARYFHRYSAPVPFGDFDGDGRTDLALFRPSTGTWYVRGLPATRYGTSGDVPLALDVDRDGRADVAVFRPSNGTWYLRGRPSVTYGTAGDVPVAADYDGDGRADLAVFRPSNGTWYVRGRSSVAYGTAGDVAVPGDYDGDGQTEPAVFRPSAGSWHVLGSRAVLYGTAGDVPVRR